MNPRRPPPAAGPPPAVGLWIEAATPLLTTAQGADWMRIARGLVVGLDALPDVESIVVPCLPAAVPIMARLFADAARPDSLLSDKLILLPVGRDPVRRTALARPMLRLRARALEKLAADGATPAPHTWRGALSGLAAPPVSPPLCLLRAARRLARLARLALLSWVADAGLNVLGWLPAPHTRIAADLRRRHVSAAWLLVAYSGPGGRRLPGPKLLDLGGVILPASSPHPAAAEAVIRRLASTAAAVVAPSRHAAVRRACRRLAVSISPPAPLPVGGGDADEQASRRQLADDLRALFQGDGRTAPHRHFCDFPFELVDYIVAAAARGPTPVLPAYALVLRRHRRDVKLVVDGLLPQDAAPRREVHALGLSFDVAEAAGLGEQARLRLLRHARAVVVADLDGGCLSPVFGEAVAVGTPVVLGRTAAAREAIPAHDLASPEYFDIDDQPAAAVCRAILHALDHPGDVLTRQRALLARQASRTWRDVVVERLRLVRGPSNSCDAVDRAQGAGVTPS